MNSNSVQSAELQTPVVWQDVQPSLVAIVLDNFIPTTDGLLPVYLGDRLRVRSQTFNGLWLFVLNHAGVCGVVPRSIVMFPPPRTKYRAVVSLVIEEVTATLREWSQLLHETFVQLDKEHFKPLMDTMREIITLRSHLVAGKLPVEEAKETVAKVINKIDFINHLLKLDLVVRNIDGSSMCCGEDASAISVYRQHILSSEKIDTMMGTKRKTADDGNVFDNSSISFSSTTPSHNYFRILLKINNFVYAKCPTEDTELIISICEASSLSGGFVRSLCEKFVVKWPKDLRLLKDKNNLVVLFTNIDKNDIASRRLFLVCHVCYQGNFISGSNGGGINFRKPLGVAAVEITDLFTFRQGCKSGKVSDIVAPFLHSSNESESLETTFRKLVFDRKSVNGSGGKDYLALYTNLSVSFGRGHEQREEHAFGNHHDSHPLLMAAKIGLPHIMLPTDVRNDLYVTLLSGEFSRLDKRQDRNVQVTVEVCDDTGKIIPDVLSCGVGLETQGVSKMASYSSVVYYHECKPYWNETIRVTLPVEAFAGAHIRLLFRHRSSRQTTVVTPSSSTAPNNLVNCEPWAMAFIRLVDGKDGTAIKDGQHELCIYKFEKRSSLTENGMEDGGVMPLTYLTHNIPQFRAVSHPGQNKRATSQIIPALSLLPKDIMIIHTSLCSTKLTQNDGLLSLLKWRCEPYKLRENLLKFNAKVTGSELVKFLPDVLDALFAILSENDALQKDDFEVFKSLVHVILLVQNEKYSQFIPVLDLYVKDNFSATLAYNKMLLILTEELKSFSNELINTVKALKYILKFVIRSRRLYASLHDGKEIEAFMKRFHHILLAMVKLMQDKTVLVSLKEVQSHCFQNLIGSISTIVSHFDRVSLTEVFVSIIDGGNIDPCSKSLNELVRSELFIDHSCRSLLLPAIVSQLNCHLQNCTRTFGDILDILDVERRANNLRLEDVSIIAFKCLRPVVQLVANRQRGDSVASASLVANLICLLRVMEHETYVEYIENFGVGPAARSDLLDFIMELLSVFRDLLQNAVFPSDWACMILLQNQVILRALHNISHTIRDNFTSKFVPQAWSNFFQCSITFLLHPSLQLETFSEHKRHRISLQYSKDMRKEMALQIKRMWFNLDHHKRHFVPEMVGPFLEMSLVSDPDLRKATIPIFFDMMQCEYYSENNFEEFEIELINKLDALIEGGRGDEHFKDMFQNIMHGLCMNHTYLCQTGSTFVTMASDLMQLLLEYRTISTEESCENQMSCIVNLLDFYRDIGRDELYIRYLKKLINIHDECQNWGESAFTILQYSQLLQWTDRPLSVSPAALRYEERHAKCLTHRQLREALYYDAIDNLERANLWENALILCRELVNLYESETFEYPKLSKLLIRMADFYAKIVSVVRPDPEYFRVSFFGRGFPAFLQNKAFIYRGQSYERLPEFQSRICDQFPNAELLRTLEAPSLEAQETPTQSLQIIKVDPVMDAAEQDRFFLPSRRKLHPHIFGHYKFNSVRTFVFSRRIRKPIDDAASDNEFANLWTERTVMQTKNSFPGILRWFSIQSPPDVFELCPLDNALDTMIQANTNLRMQLLEYTDACDTEIAMNPLAMKLKGIIDASVMGGTAMYEKAFFTKSYALENPEHAERILLLQELMAEQVPLLNAGINLHARKHSIEMKPFHDHLVETFAVMRAHVEQLYGWKPAWDCRQELEADDISPSSSILGQNMYCSNNGRQKCLSLIGVFGILGKRISFNSGMSSVGTTYRSSSSTPSILSGGNAENNTEHCDIALQNRQSSTKLASTTQNSNHHSRSPSIRSTASLVVQNESENSSKCPSIPPKTFINNGSGGSDADSVASSSLNCSGILDSSFDPSNNDTRTRVKAPLPPRTKKKAPHPPQMTMRDVNLISAPPRKPYLRLGPLDDAKV